MDTEAFIFLTTHHLILTFFFHNWNSCTRWNWKLQHLIFFFKAGLWQERWQRLRGPGAAAHLDKCPWPLRLFTLSHHLWAQLCPAPGQLLRSISKLKSCVARAGRNYLPCQTLQTCSNSRGVGFLQGINHCRYCSSPCLPLPQNLGGKQSRLHEAPGITNSELFFLILNCLNNNISPTSFLQWELLEIQTSSIWPRMNCSDRKG